MTTSGSDGATWRDALSATAPATSTRPALTSAAASARLGASPRATSSASSLFLAPSSGPSPVRCPAPGACALAGASGFTSGGLGRRRLFAGAGHLFGRRAPSSSRLRRWRARCRPGCLGRRRAPTHGGRFGGRRMGRLAFARTSRFLGCRLCRGRRAGVPDRLIARGWPGTGWRRSRALCPPQVLLEMLEVLEKNGGLFAQRADDVGSGLPALVDQALSTVFGVVLGASRAEQLLGHLLGPCRCHSHKGGGRLAAALQLIFCSHTRSVGPPDKARARGRRGQLVGRSSHVAARTSPGTGHRSLAQGTGRLHRAQGIGRW